MLNGKFYGPAAGGAGGARYRNRCRPSHDGWTAYFQRVYRAERPADALRQAAHPAPGDVGSDVVNSCAGYQLVQLC